MNEKLNALLASITGPDDKAMEPASARSSWPSP